MRVNKACLNMLVVQITPGSGGTFYCQNCLRDLALVRALRTLGHDVLTVPLYLPLAADESPGSLPAFYSAVPLYLQHRFPRLSRLAPDALWRVLESPAVTRLAARRAGATRATSLAGLTISMLRGEAGQQAAELERLVAWLRDASPVRPDVVVLSDALLMGLARRLKQALHVPVACWLQDEHVWADAMPPRASAAVWRELRARAADVDLFLAVSRHYASRLSAALAVDAARMQVVHIGVDPAAYSPAAPGRKPRAVGFLSRLSADEGFELFVDAFMDLHRETRFADVRLHATGGPASVTPFLRRQMRRLQAAGLADRVLIDLRAFGGRRADFLASLSLLSVPAPEGEAFGTYIVEAMAAGVPVVQPPVGAYPEILSQAGCGLLSQSVDAPALARAWARLLDDPDRLALESSRGRAAVAEYFNVSRMARETAHSLGELCARVRPVGQALPETKAMLATAEE